MAGWKERLIAAAHGEVTRANLDPYKAAGAGVYEYVMTLDSLRQSYKGNPMPENVQIALLCGWVAFAHQVLGDEMLDADAAFDPSTASFVPPVTAQQVMVLYAPVQSWIARTRSAQANSQYVIDVPLPVDLPTWIEAEPCPTAHLLALRKSAKRFADYTEGLSTGFDSEQAPAHAQQIINSGKAEAASAVEYAESLWGATSGVPGAQVHEAIESNLKQAVESYFYLGQVLVKPSLADLPHRIRHQDNDEGPRGSFLDAFRAAAPARRASGAGALGAGILGGIIGGGLIGEVLGGMSGDNQGWGGNQGWGDDQGWGNDQGWDGF